ncbi:hypothetical protein H2203_009168 [Taxawa tesnikishii (nom. ined.)]|nr:hypothetical protein H2203_009168 [Dothideales sp. JES 119]
MRVQAAIAGTLALATGIYAHPSPKKDAFSWAKTKYMIAFGDSYTYVQGTQGRQNFSFIGDYLDISYTPEQLLSNKIVQNQTATAEGGPNWVEYLTGCGLKPGLTSPLTCKKQLWDFAFAGADISLQYTPLHHNFTVPLVNQTAQFAQYGYPVLSKFVQPAQTLVAFWIGINDLITTLFGAVQSVYDLGYRNFLFMNLPPLDRTPGNSKLPIPNNTTQKVDWYDAALANHSAAFGEQNADAKVMLFDANTFLNGVMDNASEYGIKNTTGYCASYDQPYINTDPASYGCLPLPEYFWFNTGHMTSHVHEILAGRWRSF